MPDDNLISVTSGGKPHVVAWQPTGALRIAIPSGQQGPRVLQQEWYERYSGQREWRNIPVVEVAIVEYQAVNGRSMADGF